MGRLLPNHPTLTLLLLAAAIAGGRCAPVYRPDYLVDGNQLVDMQYHMGPVVSGGSQCPGRCAYPFAAPEPGYGVGGGGQGPVLRPPNGDPGVDGMVIVLGHELAELATNPLVNAWYAGDTPTAPTEVADLCVGVYGEGGGAGGFVGKVSRAADGSTYNVNGVNGRRFLVQWLWNPVLGACYGPNSSN
uniref:Uncharacterized protein n=1 Tax=Avena sativa TaxID=4498 RepID=A0ACD5U8N2_AVESA